MDVILDTQAILWYALDDGQLSNKAKAVIEGSDNQVYVSPASYWEVAIKICIGKYRLDTPFDAFWTKAIADGEFTVLPIEIAHANRLLTMPLVHRDPFDRMLVAQALCQKISLVSNDSQLDQYDIQRIW